MDEALGYDDLEEALGYEAYSPKERRELVGPYGPYMDDPEGYSTADIADRAQAIKQVLTVARDSRLPPGPQVAVPSGVLHSLPKSADAMPVRVDTEESYREFRQSGREAPVSTDALNAPENAENVTDALSYFSQTEVLGNIMDYGAASQGALFDGVHTAFSKDQECLFCGVRTGGHPICLSCVQRPEIFQRGYASQVIGYEFERGYASQVIGRGGHGGGGGGHHSFTRRGGSGFGVPWGWGGGYYDLYDDPVLDELRALRRYGYGPILGDFGERGSAAALYDDNPSATIGDGFFRRTQDIAEYGYDGKSAIVGDGFYRLPVHGREYQGGTSALVGIASMVGDVMALSVPSTIYAEQTPLSFHKADQKHNIAAWKQGPHLYSSIRVTGWDKRPRILTGATPYARELGIVVGYAESARISPTHTVAILDPLARQLGSSRILPRLSAAAPAVLRVSADKATPLIVSVMGQ